MRRWLFGILAAVCLLVGIAIVAAWYRSYRTMDIIEYGPFRLETYPGLVECLRCPDLAPSQEEPVHRRWPIEPFRFAPQTWETVHLDSVGFIFYTGTYPTTYWVLVVPHWFLLLASAVVPGCWLALHTRRCFRRPSVGLCHQCGYDLRAHQPGDRCPECGEPHAALSV